MPEELLELWASLPHCERQRRRRRFFFDQVACCSRPFSTETLSSIDTRVRILEEALAEFLHATAASIPVPPTRSSMKHAREDAGSPSSPAPASTSNEIIFDISRAEKLCSDALSPSPLQPAVAASALAAAPTDLASDRSADVPMAEPTSRPAQPSPIPRPPWLERPFTGICGTDPWWATPTPVPSGMVTGPSASDPVTLPATAPDSLPDSEAKHRH